MVRDAEGWENSTCLLEWEKLNSTVLWWDWMLRTYADMRKKKVELKPETIRKSFRPIPIIERKDFKSAASGEEIEVEWDAQEPEEA